jgi:HPt (histidine-containing phosphotransfer) domain-containing protein
VLDDIRAAVDRGDAQEFGRATNTLKGSLSCLDASAASEAISNLEKIGTQGATAKQALQELEREVARLTAALAELAAVPSRSEKGCLAGA